MPKTLFIGIDLSSENNVAQFMCHEGNTLRPSLRFPNSQAGLEQLVRVILRLVDEYEVEHVHIGMEATGLYWWHLREALANEPRFSSLQVSVYVINPSLIKGFKQAYPTLPKTDAVDAWVIADRLRFGRLKPITEDDLRYQPLVRLTRFRLTMVQSLTKDKNRACQLLFLKCSEYHKEVGREGAPRVVENGGRRLANCPSASALQILLDVSRCSAKKLRMSE